MPKSLQEWETLCGQCKNLVPEEIEELFWIQEGSWDHAVIAPVHARISRYNSQQRYQFALSQTTFSSQDRVLEIGCHYGVGYPFFKIRGVEYVGIDIREDYIVRARKLYPEALFLPLDATSLPFPDEFFTKVVFFDVLEHVPLDKVSALFHEVIRVLRCFGECLFTTPKGEPTLVKSLLGQKVANSHIKEYQKEELVALCCQFPLRIEKILDMITPVFPAGKLGYAITLLVAEWPPLYYWVGRFCAVVGYSDTFYLCRKLKLTRDAS